MSSSKATSFRWSIVDFKAQRLKASSKKVNLASDFFGSIANPTIQFALFYNEARTGLWKDCNYGIVLKNIGNKKSIEVDLKVWLENEEGEKFGEYSVQKQTFKEVNDQYKFKVKNTGNDWNLLINIDNEHETLFICCELFDLNPHIIPLVNCDNKFLKNQWLLYEKKYHDAIIKVGGKEFKIFKCLFMAQSPVFEQMFTSNFKEGVTNTVNVQDVDEETMQHLTKWFYTNQIEKDSPIEKLFAAADKYDVKLLKSTCVQLMINSFDSVNAFSSLIIAVQHNEQILKDAALSFIAELPSYELVKFFKTSTWIELNNKNIKTAQEVGDLLEEKLKK